MKNIAPFHGVAEIQQENPHFSLFLNYDVLESKKKMKSEASYVFDLEIY